jgi:hypothetical protein
MKKINEWNEELEFKLMSLSDDDLKEWFKENTINWKENTINWNDELFENKSENNLTIEDN